MSPLRSTGTSDELKIIFGILLWVVGPLFFQTIRKLHPLKAVWEMMRLIRMPARRRPGVRIGEAQIPDEARLRHTHIVGATGTGKTVLIEQLIFSDLRRGAGALIIDPKGERTFYEEVKRYCIEIGRGDDLYLLSATFPEESAIWNPCGLGNVSELQTKFYNSAIYNEPHYAKACEYGLLTAFGELTKKYKDGFTIQELLAELKRLEESDRKNIVTGLFFDLNNLAHGEWEPILACGSRAKSVRARSISILDVVTQNKILFVDLPTEGKRVQSSRIGRLLTQEILLISGMRKRNPELIGSCPFSVYIDEFDAFATESFATFLNKGRSSGFMIHLAHQTLSDLNLISKEFSGQIMGNCNVRFIFRQDDPDDAERWARFIGTHTVVKETYRTSGGLQTGESSNREAQEFLISPDVIKSLPTGTCVFSCKTEATSKLIQVPYVPRVRAATQSMTPYPVAVQRGLGVRELKSLNRPNRIAAVELDSVSEQKVQGDWGIFEKRLTSHKEGNV